MCMGGEADSLRTLPRVLPEVAWLKYHVKDVPPDDRGRGEGKLHSQAEQAAEVRANRQDYDPPEEEGDVRGGRR